MEQHARWIQSFKFSNEQKQIIYWKFLGKFPEHKIWIIIDKKNPTQCTQQNKSGINHFIEDHNSFGLIKFLSPSHMRQLPRTIFMPL